MARRSFMVLVLLWGCAPTESSDPDLGPSEVDGADRPSGETRGSPCGPTFELYFEGYCYLAAGFKWMDYNTAKQVCASSKSKVVSIHSIAEDKLVYSLLHPLNKAAWIGLQRTGKQFGWEDGSPLTYANWAPGEPNNENGGESCSVIWGPNVSVNGLASKWNDAPCGDPGRDTVICKRKP